MERRNPGEEFSSEINSLWNSCSSVPSASATFFAPMAENHHFNSPYFLPFNEEEQHLTPLIPSPTLPTPPILPAFNRQNFNNIPSSTVSPSLINRQIMETPPSWQLEKSYLIEVINRQSAIIQSQRIAMANQGLKPFDAGFNPPLFSNSPVAHDPYSRFLNGGVAGETKCGCFSCKKNEVYPKDFHARRLSNDFRRCYPGEVDEIDYFNMSRLQIGNNPQFQMLSNATKYTSLEEVRGRMVSVAKDQHGCRFLQRKIDGGRKEDMDIIFGEIKDYISELMVDQFGNYLVQKILDTCNAEQRTEILISVTRREHVLVKICRDIHGTRSIQRLLEHLTNEQEQARIVSALTSGTVVLITDTHGHHVIQYCVKYFPNELKKYLLDTVAAHFVEIAMDRSGCCVLQDCVRYSEGEIKERLVAEITRNALVLAQDPFGNYVVQFLVEQNTRHYTTKLLKSLEGSFVSLSMQKFSSNVVEKCLLNSCEDQSSQIIKELFNSPDILKLLQDAYGNYVIQSALLKASKAPGFYVLVDLVRKHEVSLRSHPYGKKILAKLDQLTR